MITINPKQTPAGKSSRLPGDDRSLVLVTLEFMSKLSYVAKAKLTSAIWQFS